MPTPFGLIPGALQGGCSWHPVEQRLGTVRHRAVALTLPGPPDGDDTAVAREDDQELPEAGVYGLSLDSSWYAARVGLQRIMTRGPHHPLLTRPDDVAEAIAGAITREPSGVWHKTIIRVLDESAEGKHS